ncbi:hypothetical protein V2J09_024158 [Rumex salicifolius]
MQGDQSEQMDLPPGFRFHPTDEEIISDYLFLKSQNIDFISVAIGEADLRKLEPWELPCGGSFNGGGGMVLFLSEGKKVSNWTENKQRNKLWILEGYRKRQRDLPRAPKGVKSNWVMHEYRLDGIYSQSDWVISRVFHKNQSGKKTHISALPAPNSQPAEFNSLPPLIDYTGVDTNPSLPSTSLAGGDSYNQQLPITPFYWPNFSDHLGFPNSFANNDDSLSKYLIDDNLAGNDLLSSLKKEPFEDTGPGGSGYGGSGGYIGGDLSDDNDTIDTNSYINF